MSTSYLSTKTCNAGFRGLLLFLFRSDFRLRMFSFWFQFQCQAAIGMKSSNFRWNSHCIGSDYFCNQVCRRALNGGWGRGEWKLGLLIIFVTRKMVFESLALEITKKNLRNGLGFKTRQEKCDWFLPLPLLDPLVNLMVITSLKISSHCKTLISSDVRFFFLFFNSITFGIIIYNIPCKTQEKIVNKTLM